MKIQYMSDLHLEFGALPAFAATGDILVLAGDIHLGTKGVDWINALEYDRIFYLLGNHEFYGNKFLTLATEVKEKLSPHVTLLDNTSVIVEDINFIGSTLWSNANPMVQFQMNDYRKIKYFSKKLTVENTLDEFKTNIDFLLDAVIPGMKNVILTHHAPDMQMVDMSRYGEGAVANTAYATNITHEFNDVNLWISGHTHAVRDLMINGIRCVSNCRGYVGYETVTEFNPERFIEL